MCSVNVVGRAGEGKKRKNIWREGCGKEEVQEE
jgi:hypothetical protein